MKCSSIQQNEDLSVAASSIGTSNSNANSASSSTMVRRIALYGMVHAIVVTMCFSGTSFGSGYESIAIARSIADSWNFANPYESLPTGPTAHLAPLFPVYLGLLLHWVGNSRLALAAIASISNSLVFGLLLAMLPAFAKRVFQSWTVGFIAAVAAIFVPAFQMFAGWEALYTAAALLLFCHLSLRSRTPSYVVSLLTGLLALLNPAAMSFVAVWTAGLWWIKVWTTKRVLASAAIAAAICTPWMLRNYLVLGTFSMRDSLGLELQVNNNDLVDFPFSTDSLAYAIYHPNDNFKEARRLVRAGEAAYMSRKFNMACHWVTAHPARFLSFTLQRFFLFWFPEWRNLPFSPTVWIVTFLSLPSLINAFRRGLNLESLLAVAALTFSLPYYFVSVDPRYRIPILWITTLFAWQTIRRAYENRTRNDFSASRIYRACTAVVE